MRRRLADATAARKPARLRPIDKPARHCANATCFAMPGRQGRMPAIEPPADALPPAGAVPPIVMAYGALGVLPFVMPPVAALLLPALASALLAGQALYAALILSVLGGARWGLEVRQPRPRSLVISLAMLPTLAGLGLLLVPPGWRSAQLAALAALLVVHYAWDARSSGLPGWYGRLRLPLTLGAFTGLLAGAMVSPG
jgi:hypothetical protein